MLLNIATFILASGAAVEPWPAPRVVCNDDGNEERNEYVVVDPKDPTVNLRAAPGGDVVSAIPIGSRVVSGANADGAWRRVYTQQPAPTQHAFVRESELRKPWRDGDAAQQAFIAMPSFFVEPNAKGAPVKPVFASLGVRVVARRGAWLEVIVPTAFRPEIIEGYLHQSRVKWDKQRAASDECDDGAARVLDDGDLVTSP